MSPRIAVSGYYGAGNRGDEAVLAGIRESFRRRGAAAQFTVFSADPEDTLRRHGVEAVYRMDFRAVRRAIAESDVLLSGGGSLLQDSTSLRSLAYYLYIVRLGLARHKPVMFYAQGIGPLRRSAARALTRVVANRVSAITVRDEGSRRLLQEIGVRRPPIEVTADPAFVLAPAPAERAREILRQSGISADRPLFGIAPRPWRHPRPTIEEYAQLANRLSDTGDVVYLPMQIPGDRALCERIRAAAGTGVVLWQDITPEETIAVIRELNGLLAMRLHALIFSSVAGTPMVALTYDPKVESLMQLLGQESRSVPLAQLNPNTAARALLDAAQSQSERAALLSRAQSLSERALSNVDVALALLPG